MRVAFVDDHRMVVDGLKGFLAPPFEFSHHYMSAEAAWAAQLKGASADVWVVDLLMPGMGGFEFCRRMARRFKHGALVVVSAEVTGPTARGLLEAGVKAVLDKGCDAEEFQAALASVARGQRYLTQSVAQELALGGQFDDLTQREYQVVKGLLLGKRAQQLADELFISPKTVSTYKTRAMEKLGLNTDLDLALFGVNVGWISVSAPG